MKYLKQIIIVLAAVFFTQIVSAQTADEIVNKYIDALGGKEKLAQLKTLKMNGSMNVQGTDVGITFTVVNGVGTRTDIDVPGMAEGYMIVTPTKGWNFLPYQGQTGAEEISDDQLKAGQGQIDLQSPFMNYKEKGHKVELSGKENVNGIECYKLKFTNKNGKVSTIYIDTKNYYRVKSVTTINVNGQDTEEETSYTDFRKTPEGYTLPFSQTIPNGTIVYNSIEINKPVDESIFTVK
jgi:hypothetical protein